MGARLSIFRHRLRRLRHPRSVTAVARCMWLSLVRFYDGETCNKCGRSYGEFIWWSPDPLWLALIGRYGDLRCPRCFDRQARAEGFRLTWMPMVVERDGVPTTNHWLDETRDALMMGEPDPGYFPDGKVRQPQPTWARIKPLVAPDAESPYPAENRWTVSLSASQEGTRAP